MPIDFLDKRKNAFNYSFSKVFVYCVPCLWEINPTSDCTAQKMKFSIKDFFIKCDQIRSFLRIWSHLLKKSLTENFIFCAALVQKISQMVWIEPWFSPTFLLKTEAYSEPCQTFKMACFAEIVNNFQPIFENTSY